MKLTELVQLSNEVRLALVEANGEINDETCKALLVLEDSLPRKAEGYFYLVKDLESQAEQYKERAEEFKRNAKACENYAEGLKERLKLACITMGVDELKGFEHRWKLQASKPSVIIDDETKIPGKYKTVVTTYKVDKDKIKADIEAQIEVEGCHLEKNSHVRAYLMGAKK